jgi:hypothetical protein
VVMEAVVRTAESRVAEERAAAEKGEGSVEGGDGKGSGGDGGGNAVSGGDGGGEGGGVEGGGGEGGGSEEDGEGGGGEGGGGECGDGEVGGGEGGGEGVGYRAVVARAAVVVAALARKARVTVVAAHGNVWARRSALAGVALHLRLDAMAQPVVNEGSVVGRRSTCVTIGVPAIDGARAPTWHLPTFCTGVWFFTFWERENSLYKRPLPIPSPLRSVFHT